MTVSDVAFAPRQCPAQSEVYISTCRLRVLKILLTVLGCAVLVWVVTSEDDASLVARDNLAEPSDRRRGWTFTKIFSEDLRVVTMNKNYRTC